MDAAERALLSSRPVSGDESHFYYSGGRLHCEGVAIEELAASLGTPLYVYSQAALENNLARFESALKGVRHRIFYAVKANSNLGILRSLGKAGVGFDVVSLGELERVQRTGAAAGRITFGGVAKTDSELEAAIRLGLFCVHAESVQEVEKLVEAAARLGCRSRLGLRINPDIEAKTHPYISTGRRRDKFGFDPESLQTALARLGGQDRIELTSIGCHIGSQIMELKPFQRAFLQLLELADRLGHEGFEIRNIDIGGGYGIPLDGESPFDLAALGRLLRRRQGDYQVLLEPGRYLVGNAGVLVTRVLYRKTNRGRRFLLVDAAMNDFMRPALYGAFHRVRPVREGLPVVTADLAGPVCESGDFFARDRDLPDADPGELLVIEKTGAYGSVLAHNYNGRHRPAEVLVGGGSHRVVRRRETTEDQLRLEE